MKKPELTPSSSSGHEHEIESLSPDTVAFLYGQNEELLRRRTSDYETGKRGRDARTAKLEALVTEAIWAKRARLEKEHRCFWTQILLDHYFEKREIKAPNIELIRKAVKSFPGF